MKRTAVEWFVLGLRERGVEWISTLCGHGLDPLFHAAVSNGLRLVDTRNEQTAGYIAEGAARLTGRPGVCASSSGVAAMNLFTGVMSGWYDRAPMLAITGSADHTRLGMGSFQDFDQVELARPVTKYSRLIDNPTRVIRILDEAWRIALGNPHGPVHLQFPMDIQRTEVDESDLVRPPAGSAPHAELPHGAFLDRAARALLAAERPLIVAGSGVFYNGEGPDLRGLAEAFAIPVQTPIWDRGVFDNPSGSFLGVLGAATGGPDLLGQCDCLLLAGADDDYRTGYLERDVPAFRVNRGWRALADRLTDFGRAPFDAWRDEARRQRSAFTALVRDLAAKQRMAQRTHAVDVVDAIAAALPPSGVLLIDGGSIGQWAHQLLCERRYPGHWLTCGRSGVVGYGIGGAMAARLSFPEKPVVLLSGDGAFTFNTADLECAVRQRLPFVAVVADDQSWGITQAGHLRQFGVAIGTQLGAVRFDDLARSLGARGVRIGGAADLGNAIQEGIGSGEVTVIHVPVSGGNPA